MNETTVMTESEFNLREELAGIDRDIEAAKHEVMIAEAYARLKENPDYKLVIEEKFVKGEFARVTEMLTMDAHLKDEHVKALNDVLAHVRYFAATSKYWLEDGEFARINLAKLEDMRKEITAEASKAN